jgi:hypothetical protein
MSDQAASDNCTCALGIDAAWTAHQLSDIEHLEGRTIGLGDDTCAIWIPQALINP